MSMRTRSNTKWGKAEISMGVDHLKVISQLVNDISNTKKRLAKEMSYRTPDAKFIERCNKSIQNCLGTIKNELSKVGINATSIAKIVDFVKQDDLNTAYSNVQQMMNKYKVVGCNAR